MTEFTVKDLAEILGVSKPTIQRAINAAKIEANREDKQTRYYNLDTAADISLKVKPDFDFFAFVGCFDLPPNDPEQTETPPQNMEFMRAMLSTIQEQLAAKDKQIAAYEAQIAMKDKQIEDYSARLAEAMELTKGQQYIAAADKAAGLLESTGNQEEEVIITDITDEPQEPTEPVKKTFWQKLFGKG